MKRDMFPDAPIPTPAQARAALHRFCASHFRTARVAHARTSIPTQPDDDDILLDRFIDRAEEAMAEVERLRAERAQLVRSIRAHNGLLGRSASEACSGADGCYCDAHEHARAKGGA